MFLLLYCYSCASCVCVCWLFYVIHLCFPLRYFAFLEECDSPKACTILLRGGSKDFLNEVERNLQDAMQVARNIVFEPKLLPGGGATEMALSVGECGWQQGRGDVALDACVCGDLRATTPLPTPNTHTLPPSFVF